MKHLALIPVAVLATTFIGACGDNTPSGTAGRVKVELADYSIIMPKTLKGPLVDLDIANSGSFAHELDLGQVKPGTTLEEATTYFTQEHTENGLLITDPGGATTIGPGAHFGYARTLTPGTYVFFCSLPAADGMNHTKHGMITMFTVTDERKGDLPKADLAITLGDDAITVPPLKAGAHVVKVTNIGKLAHGMDTGGVPIGTDLSRGAEVGAWMEGGQVGKAPLPIEFPGGLKSIAPGVSVVVTLTLKAAHTYMFSDDTNGLQTLIDVP